MQQVKNQVHRQYYLDWLKVVNILIIFFYHSLHFFDISDWSVKNLNKYVKISWLLDLLSVFIMPLIFLVSGASIFYAIRKTSAVRFILDKVMRLLIPLIIGVFSFSIMQVYLERVSHGKFQGSFFEFLPHYFEGVYLPGGTGNFAFHGLHLWYLLFLFIFTIVLMPLFWWLKGNTGGYVLCQLGNILAKPGGLLLFLVPTIIIQNITDNGAIISNGGWIIVHYPWFFIAGYLIVSHNKLQMSIIKSRWIWLILVLSAVLSSVLFHKEANNHQDLLVWLGLFAVLGFAMKKLSFSNKFLTYSNEAIMPFYILHQNVLLLIGFFVVKFSIPDIAKFVIIAVSAFLIIIILYEYLIRRYNSLRIIFGMKTTPKSIYDVGKAKKL
jgi:hypothetical protein